MEAMPKQFARARRKGWEHRRGGVSAGEERRRLGGEIQEMSRWRRRHEGEHGQRQLKQPTNDRKIDDPPPWPRQSASEEEMQQKITRIPISIPKTTIGVGRAAGASGGAAERPRNLRNDTKSNMEASGVCAEASGGYVDLSRPSKDKTDRYFCGRGYDEADSTSLQQPCQQPVVLL